ncbi:Plant invertase/pectin methylesterase inhibitor [Musa troglodytarum]|uniref:Plant invertase/pectin methylesterase inhibitor n=1 Tax=Musa troglodytarum TaxID=320322 RepID=A0A9E7I942_9LILI|nr:Plant invertase/pectin methylesterase inhibitor [Musa troglodytarum]
MQPDVQLRLLRGRAPVRSPQPESQRRQVLIRHRRRDRLRQGEEHVDVRLRHDQERHSGGGGGVRDLRREVQERQRGAVVGAWLAVAGELRLRVHARQRGSGVRQRLRQAVLEEEPRRGVPGGDGEEGGLPAALVWHCPGHHLAAR